MKLSLSLILAILGALATAHAARIDGLRVKEFGVFDKAPENGEVPEFRARFSRETTGRLTARIGFEHNSDEAEVAFVATLGLFTYDNRAIGEKKKRMVVDGKWKYAWLSQAFGWEEPGRWSIGTYRVRVSIEGEVVAETAFSIFDGSDVAAGKGIALDSVEFYEGGDAFRAGSTNSPATRFSQRSTRRIYWVARGKNLFHGKRAQRPDVVGYFYAPDGSLMAETPNRFALPPEVEEAVLAEGVGWSRPGLWKPGKYRFELEHDNKRIFAKEFELVGRRGNDEEAPRPSVVHYGVMGARVFDAPDAKGSKAQFDGDLKILHAEVEVANNPNHKRMHRHRVHWELIGPGQQVYGQTDSNMGLRPDWKVASQRVEFSLVEGRTWEPGHYKLRISIDGKLEQVVRFTIGLGAGA